MHDELVVLRKDIYEFQLNLFVSPRPGNMVSDYPTTELFSNRVRPAYPALINISFVLSNQGETVRLTCFVLKYSSDTELDFFR